MTRRRITVLALALVLLVGGRLFMTSSSKNPEPVENEPERAADAATPLQPLLRRPPSAVAELGVLTDRSPDVLADAIDRHALADRITTTLCGDVRTCDAVRATLRDEHSTTIRISPVSEWAPGLATIDAGVATLPANERARLARQPNAIVVRVNVAPSSRDLAVRTSFAAAAALARLLDALVVDPLRERIESAAAFAAHVPSEPLGAPTFRADRIRLVVQPREDGAVRLVTVGLSRWGAPDVEAAAVPRTARTRVGDLVLAVAAVVAEGAERGPIALPAPSGDGSDAETAASDATTTAASDATTTAGGASRPDAGTISVDLVPAPAEPRDASDFIARIEPPDGEGPVAYLELAERFFGPGRPSPPDDETAHDRTRARADLAAALARSAASPQGSKIFVRLPFPIPGDDAGTEALWVEVLRVDARTITGRVADDPLAATDVSRGDAVTRDRADVLGTRTQPADSR